MTAVINRRERKKAALRSRITASAISLFSLRGLDAVTIDEIAAAADVGKGTIYNYFSTKEDIVVAFMADLESRLASEISQFQPGEQPIDSVLAEYILLHFQLKEPYHAFVRVFLAQMFSRTEGFLPYMVEMQKYVDPPLESLFATLEERGAIRAGIDIPQLILSFKTMHLGLTALWAVEGPPFQQTYQVVRQQMHFFAEGIQRKTP